MIEDGKKENIGKKKKVKTARVKDQELLKETAKERTQAPLKEKKRKRVKYRKVEW